jgi:hypothetical protein
MKRAWPLLIPLLITSRAAWAQEGAEESNYVAPLERRGGFTLGLDYGLGIGSYVGYPNEVEKIDNPEFRSSTGLTPAGGYSIWLGGALRDWFTVGVGLFTAGGGSGEVRGGAGGFGMRIEAFPLFPLGAAWRDLGLIAELGAGSGALQDEDGEETANGGNMSVIGLGAFFEPWQLWQMSHGPMLIVKTQSSDTMSATSLLAGWRVAFYWSQEDR